MLLFLIVGALLLYATFNHGPRGKDFDKSLSDAIRNNMSAYRPEPVMVTREHEADYAAKLHPSVMVAATMAVPISDLSAPGAVNCAIGYSVTNNSSMDIGDFLFSVSYTAPGAKGSSVENVSVPAFATQGITPINALRGRCDDVSGQVTIEHCSFSNGTDCAKIAQVVGNGAIALSRSP